MIRQYYYLTKPGIIYGNAITTSGGFFLASKGQIDLLLFLTTLAGISLVVAAGCVFNNYIDRDIDRMMDRTKNRALVVRSISARNALMFATVLGLLGFFILGRYTNLLTMGVALLGIFFYVIVYGIAKRKSVHGTVVGSISGAVPPVVGYCAVSNSFDLGAVLLFLVLVMWQMPHFYAISIFRFDDYARALIPVLPTRKGFRFTKVIMLGYIAAFIVATSLLTIFSFTGYYYLAVMLLLGGTWLWFGIRGFTTDDDKLWAKKMFRYSLIVITVFSIMISIDVV